MAIAGAGTSVGLLGTVIGNRLVESMLYGVSPTDVPTLVGVVMLLLGVAAVATALPARATTRIDPVVALRVEG